MIQPSNISTSDSPPRAPLNTWNTTSPLLAQRPYSIEPKKAFDNIILVGPGTEDVVPSELGRALNGSVIALTSCEPGSVERAETGRLPYGQGCPPPDPSTSNCIGLALVRAVSPSLLSASSEGEDVLQLLTPIPTSLLTAASCRCVIKGEVELPVCAMLDHRDDYQAMGDNIPYLQWSRNEALGAERKRVRRNLMRRGQM